MKTLRYTLEHVISATEEAHRQALSCGDIMLAVNARTSFRQNIFRAAMANVCHYLRLEPIPLDVDAPPQIGVAMVYPPNENTPTGRVAVCAEHSIFLDPQHHSLWEKAHGTIAHEVGHILRRGRKAVAHELIADAFAGAMLRRLGMSVMPFARMVASMRADRGHPPPRTRVREVLWGYRNPWLAEPPPVGEPQPEALEMIVRG